MRPGLPSARLALAAGAAFAALVLPACQAGWLLRQAGGQLAILRGCVPLEEAFAELPPPRRRKLALIGEVLEFAGSELALTPGDAFRTYYDTGGGPVSHVVFAAHPEALEPYRWCYPFLGCVPYHGHFDASDANREAARLRAEGWDTAVLPVGAYSTLGWFPEPVLSPMLDLPTPDLVELVLHESVHRSLWVPGATDFNESLATHVAREGTRLFLAGRPQAAAPGEVEDYAGRLALREAEALLVERLRHDLEALYRSGRPSAAIRRRKVELFRTARRARSLLFDSPLGLPVSNAWVLASASYHRLLPVLERIQEDAGGRPRDLMAYLRSLLARDGTLPEDLEAVSAPP